MITNYTLTSTVNFPVLLKVDVPTPSLAGCKSIQPFNVYLSAEDINPHTINLYAQNSRSAPYQIPRNKWSHLIPQWRFVDTEPYDTLYEEYTHVLSSVTPTATSLILDISGNTLGMTSSAQFYYIDDLATDACSPVFLWFVVDFSDYPATKDLEKNIEQTPAYANSKVAVVVPYHINGVLPNHINITRNGIDDLQASYWKDIRIPFVATVHGTTTNYNTSTNIEPIAFDVPVSNILATPISLTLSGADNTKITWNPASSLMLSAFDYNLNRAGGFAVGDVKYEDILLNTAITASLSTYYSSNFFRHNPYYWIANGEHNAISRVTYNCIPSTTQSLITSFIDPFKISKESKDAITSYDLSYLEITAKDNIMALTGFNGIYGLAIDSYYNMWAVDSEADKIYKFTSDGILLTSIDFSDSSTIGYGITGGCTPAGISIDGNNNIWITLFDSASVVKLDSTGAVQLVIPVNSIPDITLDPTFKPVLAETDRNNNIWVSYTNSLCSSMYKYDSNGLLLATVSLPACSNPMDVFIDRENNAWVTLTQHAGPPYLSGGVIKIDATSNSVVTSISAVHPEYLTIDIYNNIWFTASANTLYKYSSTGAFSTAINIGTFGPSQTYDTIMNQQHYNALEGLTTNENGKIFVINSIDNIVYILNNDGTPLKTFTVFPNNTSISDPNNTLYNKSAQAFGDWSGYRWATKYVYNASTTPTVVLTGISNTFDISDFANYEIRRFNESWDASTEIQNLAIPPHIHDNPFFWNKYMDALIGNNSSIDGKAYGRQAYERISNFVSNHSDIDTCNISQLYSLAKELDVPIDDYELSFPPELRKIMDIASVNQQALWGCRCGCGMNLTNNYTVFMSGNILYPFISKCDRCGHMHQGNRGDAFNPLTYTVTAYTPFIIRDKVNQGEYLLITPPVSTSNVDTFDTNPCSDLYTPSEYVSTYPLVSVYNWILPNTYLYSLTANIEEFEYIAEQYCFYNYVPGGCTEQVAGLINWEDPNTTLNENLSTIQNWYGESQTLEKIINYALHKGLGLV